jgi:hypothetical protein
VLREPRSEDGLPPAAFSRAAAPLAPADLAPDVLRRCLEALFRSSGASSTSDLRLVGIYPRVPVGAIRGVSLGERGAVDLRLEPGPAAPGMLVVGRRVSSGQLATCEVSSDGGEPPAPLRRRGRRR